MMTKILGRKISHMKISEKEEAERMVAFGVPKDYAKMLAELDTHIAQGKEDITSDTVLKVGGKEPQGLEAFLVEQGEKGVWNKRP